MISGKKLAKRILLQITKDIAQLSQKNITPQIAIITLGSENTWSAYVYQKLKLAEKFGIKRKLITFKKVGEQELIETIDKLNKDESIHGIIVQRPLPNSINRENIIQAIAPEKDIDGFRTDSKFESPIWLAVETILKRTRTDLNKDRRISPKQGASLKEWLFKKSVVIIGKGETGGEPIILSLQKRGIEPKIIDSKTKNRHELLKNADIIISAVGKPNVVGVGEIKKDAILIGIGIHRGEDKRLHGDFNEEEIKNITEFYTPTPGGVGPLNLAYLFKNLLKSAKA